MNIFPALKEATANRDFDKFSSYFHDEYTFVRHQSGTTMNREETLAMIKGFLASDSFTIEQHRCVYENEDILVKSYSFDEVKRKMNKKQILNGLTLIALQWFFLNIERT